MLLCWDEAEDRIERVATLRCHCVADIAMRLRRRYRGLSSTTALSPTFSVKASSARSRQCPLARTKREWPSAKQAGEARAVPHGCPRGARRWGGLVTAMPASE